jgi:hypothetical protein
MDLSEYLKKQKEKTQSKISNKRQSILKEFVDEINTERLGTSWKPVGARTVAIKLAHLTEFDLFYFLSVCRDYKKRKGSFSKCFFGSLKNK